MLKRDSLTAQMQQLSHTLAKVKRLILEDEEPKALEEVQDTLGHYFGLLQQEAVSSPTEVFLASLTQQAFQAEELDMLAAFLDELAGLSDEPVIRRSLWEKVIAIYDLLEQDYRVLSFEHLSRRALLQQALHK